MFWKEKGLRSSAHNLQCHRDQLTTKAKQNLTCEFNTKQLISVFFHLSYNKKALYIVLAR